MSLPVGAHAASIDDQLLPPEQVFLAETEALPGEMLLHWKIAAGYYVYRDRFHFSSASDVLRLETATLPAGQLKQDDYFGQVEVLRDSFTIALPYEALDTEVISLNAVSQGCSDLGVCYPPYEQLLTVALSESDTVTPDFSRLTTGLSADSEFLQPDQAFVLSTRFRADGALVAEWEIARGYYLYREKFAVTLSPDSRYRIEGLDLPHGHKKTDDYFGEVEVFYNEATVVVVLAPVVSGSVAPLALDIVYQGCADAGLCYPPITKSFVLEALP